MRTTFGSLALGACLSAAGWADGNGSVFYPDELVALARQRCEESPEAAQRRDQIVAGADRLASLSDQEIWDFVPPAEQRRALNVSFGKGCPVHGTEIFRKAGHYPWILDPAKPFKVTCPVGGESYPDNDFQPWNPGDDPPAQTAEYIDHGTGWLSPQGVRYWFVAHYVFWQRWQRDVRQAIDHLSQAWLLTGDPRYAHAAGIILSRIAVDWSDYHYQSQAYHNGGYPNRYNGRIVDHIWSTGWVSGMSRCYDAIRAQIATDAPLAAFLAGKGIASPNELIEQKLLAQAIRDIFAGTIRGNMGMHQQAVITAAAALGNTDPTVGPTKAEVLDWVLYGGGEVNDLLWNGFYRDGHGGESSPGYSMGWCFNFYEVARLIPFLGFDIWSNPKVKKMADIGLDLAVTGRHTPSTGDSGSILGSGRVGWSYRLQGEAYKHYGDPRHAAALATLGRPVALWDDLPTLPETVASDLLTPRTRLLGGYGMAILEGGEGDHRRGLSCYYGHAGGGHGHRDRLNIELLAFGRPMLPDMGYPAHWLAKNSLWTSNTTSHYAVLVDQQPQQTYFGGEPVAVAGTARVQFAELAAERVAFPGRCDVYRRQLALVDLDPERGYLFDVFRVNGGRQHDWSYHGPPFPEVDWELAEFGPVQARGTLAGEEIAFGEAVSGRRIVDGAMVQLGTLDGVINDQRHYGERGQEGFATYDTQYVVSRLHEATIRGKMTDLPVGQAWLWLRAYDYNSGQNTVQVQVGDQTVDLTYGSSGTLGWAWQQPVPIEVTAAEAAITVIGKSLGQSWFLLDSLAITTEPTEPRIEDASRSGFQYLFNVRRAPGANGVRLRWRLPADDLGLTVHVPAGVADELILADAEPELKPNHPDTLVYLLGRNRTDGAEPLRSDFIAVTEPHRGAATITAVTQLLVRGGGDGVAVRVDHATGYDVIYAASDPAVAVDVPVEGLGTLRLAGRLVRLSVAGGQVVAVDLFDAASASLDGRDLGAAPTLAGAVAEVDVAANTVTLDQLVPEAESWVGRVVVFGGDRRATGYMVAGVSEQAGRTVLDLGDTLLRVGQGVVTQTDPAAGTVSTTTRLLGHALVDGGQHQGRWLLNEDLAYGHRIARVVADAFHVEPGDQPVDGFYQDADGDGRTLYWIADVAPGDTWRLAGSASR